ncbi:MAG TPA: hypothetical protein VGN15_11625, partial [Ktedonobacteraceae bacterium]|nr:hypothetical protein [Ktedonobacteraceae bacterium]
LSAEASAAKIGGLVEAFASLKSAVPALLLITAGFAAVFGSFELIKDSISDAGKWNQSMQVLGATVTAQGGDWKTLSKDVAEYADLQERTTTFSRDQVVDALKQLTSAGMGVAEAMQVNRIAEDASIATGQSLVTVNHALVEAMHGRTQALTMLGIGTKASIKAGMSFSDILTAIEKQMGGTAAAALNTLPGALSELGNVFESFKESVGQNLQQPLIALVQTFISLVENDGPPVVDFINNLTNTAELLGHEVTSEIIPAFNDLVAAFQPTIDGVHNLTEEVVGSHNGWQILQQLIENAAQAIRDFTEFLANNKDLVEVFFDVLIAVKAVGALTALQGSFALTVVGGGAFTTVIETLASVFTVGFIPTLQAVTASVWEFVASETAATMGLNLLIGGAIVAFIEGMQHMDSVVHTVDDTIAGLLGDIHNIYDALEELFNSISGWIPGANLLADAFGAIGTAAGNAANAIRDMNNAKAAQAGNLDSPNAIMSQQMAGLELTIATDKNPKDVAEAKKNLSALFIKRGDNADGTYGSESGNPATIPDDHTMVGGGHGKKKKS